MDSLLASIVLSTSVAVTKLSSAELEKTYWDCESTAVQGGITVDEAAACSEVFERLKKVRFRGDFDEFLFWWRQHKDRELSSRMKPR